MPGDRARPSSSVASVTAATGSYPFSRSGLPDQGLAVTAATLCCCLCVGVLLQGIKLGVSSRGWASVVTDPHSKQVVVEPDYQLITFDFVPEPSNAGAYMVPICKRYRCGRSPWWLPRWHAL